MIAHPDPHILQCEVNLALESIITNKARGGDGIIVELFQILKDNAVKCCTQYVREFARQQKRYRCIEQSFGLCGRGRGWDDLGEWH